MIEKMQGLILAPGMRVVYEGELYTLGAELMTPLLDLDANALVLRQYFQIIKIEEVLGHKSIPDLIVPAREVTPLAGNNYYETDPFSLMVRLWNSEEDDG